MESMFGSHLYGTDTPNSDTDIKGIYIPDADDILLQRVKPALQTKRAGKKEGEKNNVGDIDKEIYSLQKFFNLLNEGQTVALELLFTPDSMLLSSSFDWQMLKKNRHRLISKRADSFIQYCMKQAKKYGIKGSRVAAIRSTLEFLKELPWHYYGPSSNHAKLGDFTNSIHNFVEIQKNEFINIVDIEQNSGTTIKYLEVCDRKLQYTASLANAIGICENLLKQYGLRAFMAETNQGVDWKALSHAVRVGEQALELLETGFITFPRPNHRDLLKIKLGEYNYLDVAERIENLGAQVIAASAKSDLPEQYDEKWVDAILKNLYSSAVVSKVYDRGFHRHWP
jgi:hypothetical protein